MATTIRYAINKNKYLLEPEVLRLESLLEKSAEQSPKDLSDTTERDTLLLWLGLKTGGRASELLALRKNDLNPYDKTVFIRGIKGSNDRELPLNKWLFDRLYAYSELLPTSGEGAGDLFPIGYHRFRQIWDWYRPAPKKLHALRHTFAIRLYQKTKDLRLVQVALGHRNITNTMVYADYVYSQQELRKLIL